MKKLLLSLTMIAALLAFFGCKDDDDTPPEETTKSTEYIEEQIDANTVQVTVRDYGNGTGNVTFTSDKTWVLDGFVFVNSGQTLTIEPGTIIKAESGQGSNASALIVARGGIINAAGTAAEPIIMTSAADQIVRHTDNTLDDPQNLPAFSRGLWGGLIVLGEAGLNSVPGETQIEGIPSTESRGLYGGSDDADNSGTIQYLSVRHGGTDIGAGNEINGITLGGVGSGTTLDHLEIVSNVDDGIEWFGGTARVKYLISAFCGDDGIDYDEGFRGFTQYLLVFQESSTGNRGAEQDGGTNPEDGTPYATPVFHNVTMIANGIGESQILEFRDNAGGKYYNSIFYGTSTATGVRVEDLGSGQDSRQRLDDGDLVLDNNIWYNIGTNTLADIAPEAHVQAHLTAGTNDIVDPAFVTAIPGTIDQNTSGLDLQATATEATNALATPADGWFTTPAFKGAFGATNWADGWSFLSTRGYLAP